MPPPTPDDLALLITLSVPNVAPERLEELTHSLSEELRLLRSARAEQTRAAPPTIGAMGDGGRAIGSLTVRLASAEVSDLIRVLAAWKGGVKGSTITLTKQGGEGVSAAIPDAFTPAAAQELAKLLLGK
ncbi:MAG TPA: hypothetical protein PLD47_14075 [Aggregatilineales bacterium]|nr:hypothetical protein [Anaerolineales bacterium]HRE48850.1 hypothetical protein [Aggregatilineales bacterium]